MATPLCQGNERQRLGRREVACFIHSSSRRPLQDHCAAFHCIGAAESQPASPARRPKSPFDGTFHVNSKRSGSYSADRHTRRHGRCLALLVDYGPRNGKKCE